MTNVAVVIGIDRYATDLTSLDGAVADAQAFASWLIESGEVAAADLQLGLLPTSLSPPDPAVLGACARMGTTVLAVNAVLGRLLAPPSAIGRLYFFFSGHGASSSNPAYPEEAVCLEGFTDVASINALELSSLMCVLNAIPADERFILIDGCRNAVFSDEVQFGVLSRRPRPAKGQRRNYVLRATGPGRKAAEVNGRGLFTLQLCDGLYGKGSAKRWDPTAADGEGGYSVHWRALAQYVGTQVATQRAAQHNEQLIFEEGEHPADADPQLAAFAATHFRKSRIAVQLLAPSIPPAGTQVFLRRNDSMDPDVSGELSPTGRMEFEVSPSAWVLWGQAAGWRSHPRSKAVLVYADQVDESIVLVPESPLRIPDGSLGRALAGRGYSPLDRAAAPLGPAAHPADGRLTITVGGRPLRALCPPVHVTVLRENGNVVADPVMADEVILPPGLYRVRLDVAQGAWNESLVLVSAGDDEPLSLPMPDTSTVALARTLAAAHKPAPEGGFAMPSEKMGLLVGTSTATVAAIAVVQAVNGADAGLQKLQLAQRWAAGAEIGIEVLIADERETPAADGCFAPLARLWRMGTHETVSFASKLAATNVDAPIESASLVAEPGGWWLQLQDQRRQGRTVFKLATQVLPGHVTLVVRHRLPSRLMGLHQYAVQRDAPARLSIQFALVEAEAFQRSRLAGRDPTVDPAVHDLIDGKWFEPFSAMVAAAALLERGETGAAMFEQILQALDAHDIRAPDVTVLRAARAAREGRDDLAAALVRDVLGLRQVPIVDSLLERLDAEARRLGAPVHDTIWIADKLQQTIGHPLWTLRRDEEKRKSGAAAEG